MKRILFILIIVCLFVGSASADEQRQIKLSNDHPKEMIRYAFCNIFVEKGESSNEDYANVSITVENVDESNCIFVFGHSFPEKELKRLTPSIIYDNYFPGTKGGRVLDTYQGTKNVVLIQPSEKSFIQEIQVKSGKEEIQKERLPLYIAKYKNKSRKKILLLEKQVIELAIEYEKKQDMDIIRLHNDLDSLEKDLSETTFCPHRRHKPSLKKQVEPYKERLERLKSEAESVVRSHGWSTVSKEYQPYKLLIDSLNMIDFTKYEQDCGRHTGQPVARHNCKYCGLSLQQIYNKLDDYFIKLRNSDNNKRKELKAAIIGDVNLLYRCCTDERCNNHSSVWKKSEFKSKITDRYSRINKF